MMLATLRPGNQRCRRAASLLHGGSHIPSSLRLTSCPVTNDTVPYKNHVDSVFPFCILSACQSVPQQERLWGSSGLWYLCMDSH